MLGPQWLVIGLHEMDAIPSQQRYVCLITTRNRREHITNDADIRAMSQEHLTYPGPPMEATNERRAHLAKVQDILDRTPHDPTSVHWPDAQTKAEAWQLAIDGGANPGKKRECTACNLSVIDYLRKQVGLHSIKQEAAPTLYRRRMDICRGNEKRGITRCEHLAWPGLNCGMCGCFIDVKSRMKNMRCPADKWPK